MYGKTGGWYLNDLSRWPRWRSDTMKIRKVILIFLALLTIVLSSCDIIGERLTIINGYPFDVIIHCSYVYHGKNREGVYKFRQGAFATPDTQRGPTVERPSLLTKARIENEEGIILAEYSVEYILRIRNAIKKKGRGETWIFTEKGLFLKSDEAGEKYKLEVNQIDKVNYYRYYNSDEAVEELEEALRNYRE
jgi:hypothetical protein